jgi:hypothetical protein
MTAVIQSYKDDAHASPASIVLNADLLGAWQAAETGAFETAFGKAGAWKAIQVKQALKEAIAAEAGYEFMDASGSLTTLATVYDLPMIEADIDAGVANNITGWVQSQNLVINSFSPDAAFGWGMSLQGNTDWTHDEFPGGLQVLWDTASKPTVAFLETIGAYGSNNRPDFISFDKNVSDGFSPDARGTYAFGAKEWENYMNYIRQVTDYVTIPVMLWVPGGHMATVGEDTGNYELGDHSASAGTYFMGDANIGTDVSNVRDTVLNIALDESVYTGATTVSELLQQTPDYDWGLSKLRHAAHCNVFAMMWGGASSTGIVPTATNGSDDNGWLKNKVVNYQTDGQIPLYFDAQEAEKTPLTVIAQLNDELESVASVMNNEVFLYQMPDEVTWVPSSIYKWEDFLAALNPMHNVGVAGDKYWLIDPEADDETNIKYAKVAIAAFLAQSMKETIQYDACDENNWSGPAYHLDSACGQLGQMYADYGTNPQTGEDHAYSCPRTPKMEVTALTHAKWYGAPAPLYSAPDSVLASRGQLKNGKVGKWNFKGPWCSGKGTQTPQLEKQGWLRGQCKIYQGQLAGGFQHNGASGTSLEGCNWWGRGVIQTTGRQNFGTLNHFIGRSHVDPAEVGTVVNGTLVAAAPESPLFADMDLCSNPQLICSSEKHKEIKWIAGIFFWMNSVQAYNKDTGKYKDWNYYTELKKYVDGGLVGRSFVDATSGITNRGCPDSTCPGSGPVGGLDLRYAAFVKAAKALGLDPK